jgi:CRISPR-associated protein Cas2
MIYVLVTYDVSTKTPAGQKRLRRVASRCEDYGQRVQNSVFEMKVDWGDWPRIKSELLAEVLLEEDSLRFYYLGSNWQRRVEHHGTNPGYNIDGPLLA